MNKEEIRNRLDKFVKYHKIKTIVKDGIEYLVFYKAVRWNWSPWWRPGRYTKRDAYEHLDPSLVRNWNKLTNGAYKPGNTVKSRVASRADTPCGVGLHVGTRGCAKHFAERLSCARYSWRIIKVLVRPQDIVHVGRHPARSLFGNKLRCRRLLVDTLVEAGKRGEKPKGRSTKRGERDLIILNPRP